MVEQEAVNFEVASSSLASGAKKENYNKFLALRCTAEVEQEASAKRRTGLTSRLPVRVWPPEPEQAVKSGDQVPKTSP